MKNNLQTRVVEKDDEGIRLDRWFKRHYKELSFGWVAKNCRKGLIRHNGKRIDISDKIEAGAEISFPSFDDMNFDVKPNAPKPNERLRKFIEECVIFKDEDIIVLNKPAGIAVQGGTGIKDSVDSLAEFLKYGYEEKPKLVHRLDKETSGVLVLARKTSVAAKLAEIFRHRVGNKVYVALLNGVPKPLKGKINTSLEKVLVGNYEKVSKTDKGKHAITEYEVISYGKGFSLVQLNLITGRTHQLRVHMQSIDCPIIGDDKYGKEHVLGELIKEKLYLHANTLSFRLGNKNYDFTAELPEYFMEALEALGLEG